jgi:hypothetical protein
MLVLLIRRSNGERGEYESRNTTDTSNPVWYRAPVDQHTMMIGLALRIVTKGSAVPASGVSPRAS